MQNKKKGNLSKVIAGKNFVGQLSFWQKLFKQYTYLFLLFISWCRKKWNFVLGRELNVFLNRDNQENVCKYNIMTQQVTLSHTCSQIIVFTLLSSSVLGLYFMWHSGCLWFCRWSLSVYNHHCSNIIMAFI